VSQEGLKVVVKYTVELQLSPEVAVKAALTEGKGLESVTLIRTGPRGGRDTELQLTEAQLQRLAEFVERAKAVLDYRTGGADS
jgi:hypothetical protein